MMPRTLYRLLRAGMHTALLFVLPWLTGAMVGVAFNIDEVKETQASFARRFSILIVPLLVLQLIAIIVKVRRDVRSRTSRTSRAAGQLESSVPTRRFSVWVDAIDRHVRVLTGRGVGMVVASLGMVAVALAAKWGQFGVIAVAGLGIMYLASTAATLVSAFSVHAHGERMRCDRGTIEREMSQAVIDAGDAVEERFLLAHVPVPPGFRLHIEEELPARLGGDTRFALDRKVSRGEVSVSAPLPRTPRGVYQLGPAAIWYEDVLGLTRVFVASRACASLRALPRLRPLLFDRKVRARSEAEGPHSMLSRIPTDDYFRTRTYAPGDDLRRIHWKQSINTGQLVVRVAESVPFTPTRVRLVLDTYVPPNLRVSARSGGRRLRDGERNVARAPELLDDVLDLLVEVWVGIAHMLVQRGEIVTLVCAIANGDSGASRDRATLREVLCKRGEQRKWRSIGADVTWQNDVTPDALFAPTPNAPNAYRQSAKPASAIVVSAGLGLAASAPPSGTSYVIADGAQVIEVPRTSDRPWLARQLLFNYPVGAEDNRMNFRKLFSRKPPAHNAVRDALTNGAAAAIEHARSVQAPALVVRRRGVALALETP
ncbi:MAG: DUF58 domain-containing protein [Polyangiaceae bacterium]|nr:DUF58 domain-containing protein [Polyangiaceae bacterium]